MTGAPFTVRPLESGDRAWALDMVRGWGGTDYMVSRGRVIPAAALPGFCAVRPDGERVGVALYEPAGWEWQLVVLEAVERFTGIGTALVAAVRAAAEAAGCHRLWLITTNDNLRALGLIAEHWHGETSLDFIAGIPGQAREGIVADVATAARTGCGHASVMESPRGKPRRRMQWLSTCFIICAA